VLSFGSNTYGHPHPDVLELLRQQGVEVRSTDEEGDVAIALTRANR
jgi:competence protein ComEC